MSAHGEPWDFGRCQRSLRWTHNVPLSVFFLCLAAVALPSARSAELARKNVVVTKLGQSTSAEYSDFEVSPDGRHCCWVDSEDQWLGDNLLLWRTLVIDGRPGAAWARIGTLKTTPDWTHHVYAAFEQDGTPHYIHDGREITGYGEMELLTLGPSGTFVFRTARPDGWAMVVDGEVGPTYANVFSPQVSDDGRTVAYVARTADDRYQIVVNGTPRVMDEQVSSLAMSPDGNRMAWAVKQGESYHVELDDSRWGPFEGVDELLFDSGGEHFACEVMQEGKTRVLLDGRLGPAFDGPEYGAASNLAFSPTGGRLAYQIKDNDGKQVMVVDGEAGPEFDGLYEFQFSADGKRFAYQGSKGQLGLESQWTVVVDDAEGPSFAVPATQITLSARGGHYAYVATSVDLTAFEQSQQIHVDGEPGPRAEEIVALAISGDGRHLAYVARDGDESRVVRDGREVARSQDTRFSRPALNDDGGRFAYVEWDDDRGAATAVIDGKRGADYSAVIRPVFLDDGSVEYLAKDGGELLRVKHLAPNLRSAVAPKPTTTSVSGQANSWTVALDGGGDVSTIEAAIEQARPGDKITIRPGVYHESLVLTKPLEIAGDGPRERVIVQSAHADCFLVEADRAVLRGLTLRCRAGKDAEFFAIDVARGDVTIDDCDLSSNALASVGVHGDGVTATIANSWLRKSNDAGVFFYDGAAGTLEDCDVFDNASVGVAVQSGSNATVRRCRIHHNADGGVAVTKKARATLEASDLFANGGVPVDHDRRGQVEILNCRIPDQVLKSESVTSSIDDDDENVDPELKQLELYFAQPMDTVPWCLGRANKKYGRFPKLRGEAPARFRDPQTFVINLRLEPDTRYAMVLNVPGDVAFQSAEGVPLEETLFSFHTAKVPDTSSAAELTSLEVGMRVLTFLQQPTQENFRAAREAVIASEDYRQAKGDELDEIVALYKQEKYKEAKAAIEKFMPAIYLSPRAHLIASEALKNMPGDDRERRMGDNSARKEYENGRNLLNAIRESGDGSQERPHLVLRVEDEYDLLSALGKEVARQSVIREDGNVYDVVQCKDGTTMWFDATPFAKW